MEDLRRLYVAGDMARAQALADEVRAMMSIPLDAVPTLVIPLARLVSRPLDPTSAFVISRIDGCSNVRQIIEACPLQALDALRHLESLIASGIVDLSIGDDDVTLRIPTSSMATTEDASTLARSERMSAATLGRPR